jgi:hypothetical protein
MWNPFRRAELERTRERELFLSTLSTIAESFAEAQRSSHEAVAALAQASTAQAAALQEHLALFRVTSAPTSRVMRDQDEYERELARLSTDMRQQLDYVLKQTEDPEA